MEHNYEFVERDDLEEVDNPKSYVERRADLLNEAELLDDDFYMQLSKDFKCFKDKLEEKYGKFVNFEPITIENFRERIQVKSDNMVDVIMSIEILFDDKESEDNDDKESEDNKSNDKKQKIKN